MGQTNISDDDIIQATCAVLIDGTVKGTAWLVSEEGHLLTAGHLLGTENPRESVEVRFPEDIPQTAHKILWGYQQGMGIDFAVLKLANPPANRRPLPISLAKSVTGTFRLCGYGQSLVDLSIGKGEFLGFYDRQNSPANRLFKLDSKQLGQGGYSGGAVVSDDLQAVVAVQISATGTSTGAERDTVLAMPLYRIAKQWQPLETLATSEDQQEDSNKKANTEETDEPKPSPEELSQPLSPGKYALISLITFVVGSALLWVYIFKASDLIAQGIDEKVFYILLLPLGLCAGAFLFGVMRSYATYTGNALGGALELGGPVVVFLLVVIGGFKLVPDTAPFPLTIYVRDSNDDIVLKNKGSVILELGGEPQERELGDFGDAYFRQIPVRFRNQTVKVRLNAEGFELASPENEYLLTGDSITVEITRDDSLANVFGRVQDEKGKFLSNVLIRIGELQTKTREDGYFKLEIPPDQQQDRQTLIASKNGYRVWENFVYPATGQEIRIILTQP